MGTPTCAEYILLLLFIREEMQVMMHMSDHYANDNDYAIHPQKSTVTTMVEPNSAIQPVTSQWRHGQTILPETKCFTHLGLIWAVGELRPNLAEKTSLANKSAYALMGKGVHGNGGFNPAISAKIIEVHVTPRLTYGLEAVTLWVKDIEVLESCHRTTLRNIQSLRPRTATEAIFLLLGSLPVMASLYCKALAMYGAISRLDESSR